MCLVVSEMGGSLGELRRDLQLGILIAGGLVVLLAASGLIVKISKLFTPHCKRRDHFADGAADE